MNILAVIMFVFAVFSATATTLSYVLPACRKNYLPVKMLCSALFLATGFFAAMAEGFSCEYSYLIVVALLFGLIGDFFITWRDGKAFLLGVLFFSINHLLYIYTFGFDKCKPSIMPHWKYMVAGFLVVSVAAVLHIKMDEIKFTGKNKLMNVYSVILMVSFVFAVTRGVVSFLAGNKAFGLMLMIGGALFMISDAFLGAQLFGKPKTKHPEAFVLFTYFPAQTLFALSIFFQ